MSAGVLVSVVVPVYRNEATLRELHRRLALALEPETFELVFVDDASPDGSRAELRQMAAADPRVVLVELDRNGGQQRALLRGLREARGEWAVTLDADLQDPPEAIPLLLAARGGADVVFAARRGRYESRGRMLTSRAYKRVLHAVGGVPADAGSFVALNRGAIERVLELDGPSLPALIGAAGVRVASVPVVRAPRPDGRSAYSAGARVRVAARTLRWALGHRHTAGRP